MKKASKPFPPIEGEIQTIVDLWGVPLETARIMWDLQNKQCEFWEDDTYRVRVKPIVGQPPITKQLTIRRRDLGKINDHWKELQRIKNEVVGTECEAVELYPADWRTYDTSNTYHLWASFIPFPFGYPEKLRGI